MARSLPPLYALRAFEAAVRHSSFTRAGEELSITQSAVSRHIKTLEAHFACRLFQRSGRSLQLTEAARLLLPGVREGFAALERACFAAASPAESHPQTWPDFANALCGHETFAIAYGLRQLARIG